MKLRTFKHERVRNFFSMGGFGTKFKADYSHAKPLDQGIKKKHIQSWQSKGNQSHPQGPRPNLKGTLVVQQSPLRGWAAAASNWWSRCYCDTSSALKGTLEVTPTWKTLQSLDWIGRWIKKKQRKKHTLQ